ncbi:MAG: nucleotidyltransferase domain-containing protein, partial [Actinomycetota bacterium]
MLRALAQRVADELPADVVEVVLTGSVSRGMDDETSDVEMLVVTEEQLSLEEAFARSGLPEPQTWGPQVRPTRKVFGYRDGVPVEQLWWSRDYAEEQIAAYEAAEAIAN